MEGSGGGEPFGEEDGGAREAGFFVEIEADATGDEKEADGSGCKEGQKGYCPCEGLAAVPIQEGKVLLGQRKGLIVYAIWGSSGDHLEYGESVEAGAAREPAKKWV